MIYELHISRVLLKGLETSLYTVWKDNLGLSRTLLRNEIICWSSLMQFKIFLFFLFEVSIRNLILLLRRSNCSACIDLHSKGIMRIFYLILKEVAKFSSLLIWSLRPQLLFINYCMRYCWGEGALNCYCRTILRLSFAYSSWERRKSFSYSDICVGFLFRLFQKSTRSYWFKFFKLFIYLLGRFWFLFLLLFKHLRWANMRRND